MTIISFHEIKESKIIKARQVKIHLPLKPVQYYRHGWQSWSLAAWTDLHPIPVQKPAIFHPLHVNEDFARHAHPNGSWVGAAEFEDGKILLLGALSTDAHVHLLDDHLSGEYETGDAEWLVCKGSEQEVFAEYAKLLGDRLGVSKAGTAPRVWCSWYSLYTAIDEPILHRTFDEIGDLLFDVLQVDDGWQVKIGDWEPNKKFPSGMNALAQRIKSTSRRAGLWLAPLIAAKSAANVKQHPDWFLRDDNGQWVSAGFNWGEQLYALDVTHPDAKAWLADLMRQVRAWGFDYLKLDFLYAGALRGRQYQPMPREAAYRECLLLMREAMGPDAFFLTCGTPILPAIGTCDAIRVGADVGREWENYRNSQLLYNPSTPGVKNAIRTTLHRLWLSTLVHVDPDVAYFESKENFLTSAEKQLLQDLAYICDFKATSDLPRWLSADEKLALTEFLKNKPAIKQISRYVYQVGSRTVDFQPAVSTWDKKAGLLGLWAELLAHLGESPFVLKMFMMLDNRAIKKRRAGLG